MVRYLQVFTTTETKNMAEKIADALVEKRLAACVQVVGPISSTYIWKKKKVKNSEWLCIIKTSEKRYDDVATAIRRIHTYEAPEILAMPITRGNRAYLKWLSDTVG